MDSYIEYLFKTLHQNNMLCCTVIFCVFYSKRNVIAMLTKTNLKISRPIVESVWVTDLQQTLLWLTIQNKGKKWPSTGYQLVSFWKLETFKVYYLFAKMFTCLSRYWQSCFLLKLWFSHSKEPKTFKKSKNGFLLHLTLFSAEIQHRSRI